MGLEICYLFSLLWQKANLNRRITSKLLMHQFHGTGVHFPSWKICRTYRTFNGLHNSPKVGDMKH